MNNRMHGRWISCVIPLAVRLWKIWTQDRCSLSKRKTCLLGKTGKRAIFRCKMRQPCVVSAVRGVVLASGRLKDRQDPIRRDDRQDPIHRDGDRQDPIRRGRRQDRILPVRIIAGFRTFCRCCCFRRFINADVITGTVRNSMGDAAALKEAVKVGKSNPMHWEKV